MCSIPSNSKPLPDEVCRIPAGHLTSLLPYGSEWKQHRKLIQGYIGPVSAMGMIETVETIETRRLLLKILEQPTAFVQHLRAYVHIYIIFTRKSNHKQHSYVSFAGAVILRTSHGYTIETEGLDPFVDLAEEALDRSFLPAAQSGVWAVDIFPFCMLLFLRRNNMLNSRSAVSAELASWNGIQKDSACVGKSLARFL